MGASLLAVAKYIYYLNLIVYFCSSHHRRSICCNVVNKTKKQKIKFKTKIKYFECQLIKHYHSFKIFPRFWLAKSTCLIHRNQLLMTKFGRILCLARKPRKKAAFLQARDEVELFWLRTWKMADISLVSRVRTSRKHS